MSTDREQELRESIALDLFNKFMYPASKVESMKGWAPGFLDFADKLIAEVRAVPAPPPPYREVFNASPAPGGYVCGTCGVSVEVRPCPEHSPMGGAL